MAEEVPYPGHTAAVEGKVEHRSLLLSLVQKDAGSCTWSGENSASATDLAHHFQSRSHALAAAMSSC